MSFWILHAVLLGAVELSWPSILTDVQHVHKQESVITWKYNNEAHKYHDT